MLRSRPKLAAIVTFAFLLVLGLAAGCGGDESESSQASGGQLSASDIGDAARGQELFDEKNCSDCHSYNGEGGDDAPALDAMQGRLTAAEIANMAGEIWNHLPEMLEHFDEEGIPVPTFADDEMADLIAYIHGGPPDS